MADIVEALLHASTPGDEPRDVDSVDADSRGAVGGVIHCENGSSVAAGSSACAAQNCLKEAVRAWIAAREALRFALFSGA